MTFLIRNSFALLFMVLIALIPTLTFLGIDSKPQVTENRQLADLPPLSLESFASSKYLRSWGDYVRDNFSFRGRLTEVNASIRYNYFASSPADSVLLGEDGWMFYAQEGLRADFARTNSLPLSYFDKIDRYLAELEAWSDETGIKVTFMIAPNKHNVYGEYLSSRAYQGSGPSIGELISAYAEDKYPDVGLNLFPTLQSASNGSNAQTYFKIDTHWNSLGALKAVEVLAKTLSINLTEGLDSSRELSISPGNFGQLIGLKLEETHTQFMPSSGWSGVNFSELADMIKTLFKGQRIDRLSVSKAMEASSFETVRKPNILLIGDSFSDAMAPYIKEISNIGVTIRVWGMENSPDIRFNKDLIELVAPDLIIIQIVERRLQDCGSCLYGFDPKLPEFVRQAWIEDKANSGLPIEIEQVKILDNFRIVDLKLSQNINLLEDEDNLLIVSADPPEGALGRYMTKANNTPEVLSDEIIDAYVTGDRAAYHFFVGNRSHESGVVRIRVRNFDEQELNDTVWSARIVPASSLKPNNDMAMIMDGFVSQIE